MPLLRELVSHRLQNPLPAGRKRFSDHSDFDIAGLRLGCSQAYVKFTQHRYRYIGCGFGKQMAQSTVTVFRIDKHLPNVKVSFGCITVTVIPQGRAYGAESHGFIDGTQHKTMLHRCGRKSVIIRHGDDAGIRPRTRLFH
ncbi:hypothetical protein [Paraburkholderia dipogonis]|uniref:hypothetical protein n=1 Tax=Paraburkholderia dipogonis TaxID=1211383 RepID=UPI00366B7405